MEGGSMVSPCAKCGRLLDHERGRALVLCWLCLMMAADAVDRKTQAEQSQYDWRKILNSICKNEHISQRTLAFALKISPQLLTDAKKGRRAFPMQVFEMIEEKYSKYLAEIRRA
jgi:predicted transcriptional regulator